VTVNDEFAGEVTTPASPSLEKQCPACVEPIRAEALVCWHCGFDLRTGTSPARAASTNGFAIASLILGVIPFLGVGAIVAVVFGHLALGQIRRSNGSESGRGFAIAGLILGYTWIVVYVILVVAIVIFLIVSDPPTDGISA